MDFLDLTPDLIPQVTLVDAVTSNPLEPERFSAGGALLSTDHEIKQLFDSWCRGDLQRAVHLPTDVVDLPATEHTFRTLLPFLIQGGFDAYSLGRNLLAFQPLPKGQIFRVRDSVTGKFFYPDSYSISVSGELFLNADKEDWYGSVRTSLESILVRDTELFLHLLREVTPNQVTVDSDLVSDLYVTQRKSFWDQELVVGAVITTPFVLRKACEDPRALKSFQPPKDFTSPSFGTFAGVPLYLVEPMDFPNGCFISKNSFFVVGSPSSLGMRATYEPGFELSQWYDKRIEGVESRQFEVSAGSYTWITGKVVTHGRVTLPLD